MVEICYLDADIVVCIKPPRVLSTDEPGGLPDLLRQTLQQPNGDFRTVHRLDRVVSGLMVVARNAKAASELSRQVRDGEFEKEYLAVVHGIPTEQEGVFTDLLGRDKARKMTYIAQQPGKGIQEAKLSYVLLNISDQISRVKVHLYTGRTHQIRVQFASRSMPLVGERKYSELEDPCEIALFSHRIAFAHPVSGEKMVFTRQPPEIFPWSEV